MFYFFAQASSPNNICYSLHFAPVTTDAHIDNHQHDQHGCTDWLVLLNNG